METWNWSWTKFDISIQDMLITINASDDKYDIFCYLLRLFSLNVEHHTLLLPDLYYRTQQYCKKNDCLILIFIS